MDRFIFKRRIRETVQRLGNVVQKISAACFFNCRLTCKHFPCTRSRFPAGSRRWQLLLPEQRRVLRNAT